MCYLASYPYTEDLIELDSCRPAAVEERLSRVFTPLKLSQWESMLKNHPNERYVDFIPNGIKDGFRVGYQRLGESKRLL
jgi:hypothetical protein